MYRETEARTDAKPPTLMAMAQPLRGYPGTYDAEAVEPTSMDPRWQIVLDRRGATKPASPLDALQNLRERRLASELGRRLLERAAELATTTRAFDPRKLSSVPQTHLLGHLGP